MHPEPQDTKVAMVNLVPIERQVAISKARVALLVYFNAAAEICGLGAENSEHPDLNDTPGTGPSSPASRVERILVPDDDWVVGFIVTSTQARAAEDEDEGSLRRPVGIQVLFGKRPPQPVGATQGDKRLVYPPDESSCVLGFRVYSSQEGYLCRIALVYSDFDRFDDKARLEYRNKNIYSLDTQRFLWHRELPPPGLQATDIAHGYWSYNFQHQTTPLQALVFGSTEEELADITAFIADVQLGGFVVTYGSRPSRSIGPRHRDMETLEIDGEGGECIIEVCVSTRHRPTGLRIMTNRGRQLVIGHPDPDMEKQLAKDCKESKLPVVAGIFGTWSSNGDPEASLDGMGCLLNPPALVVGDKKYSSSSSCSSSGIIGEGARVEMIYWREKKKPSPGVAILSTGLAVTGRGHELSSPCATV